MTFLEPADLELSAVAVLLLIIVAAILQDDLTCTTVGLMVSNENLSLPMAWFACLVGTLLGDLIWFMLGRSCGPQNSTLTFRAQRRRVTLNMHSRQTQLNQPDQFCGRFLTGNSAIKRKQATGVRPD